MMLHKRNVMAAAVMAAVVLPINVLAEGSCSSGGAAYAPAVQAAPVAPAPAVTAVPAATTRPRGAPGVAVPRPLATMINLKVFSIAKRFSTPVKGVTGYLLDQHGHYSVVYGIGDYVLAGALISPAGANLTSEYAHQYAPAPKYGEVVAALKAGGHLVSMGGPKAPNILYAFEDPNCIFSHKLSVALAPYIKAGKVRVEIAEVAFVHPDAVGRATAILAAKNPGKAWASNEDVTKYNTAAEEGGYPVAQHPDPKLLAVLRRNAALMAKAGFGGTPGVIYRGADGKWAGVSGFPGNAWLATHLAGK